jgi:hypothetical protein
MRPRVLGGDIEELMLLQGSVYPDRLGRQSVEFLPEFPRTGSTEHFFSLCRELALARYTGPDLQDPWLRWGLPIGGKLIELPVFSGGDVDRIPIDHLF